MTKLRMVGWKPGLQTVSFVELLKNEATGSLAEAKRLVDALLDGGELEVAFESEAKARSFRERAEQMGVVIA